MEQLSAYITYARSRINPTISEAAADALVNAYVALRKVGEEDYYGDYQATRISHSTF